MARADTIEAGCIDRLNLPSILKLRRQPQQDAIEERPDATAYDATVSSVLFPTTEDITPEWVDGNPVISLDETIDHMMEYRVNYEPALEMIADEYDVDIDGDHQDYVPTQ